MKNRESDEYFIFEAISLDVENFYEAGKEGLYGGLINSLNSLSTKADKEFGKEPSNRSNYFYKFYRLAEKTYIITDDPEFQLNGYNLVDCPDPVKSLIGMDDVYSEINFKKNTFSLNGQIWRFINLYSLPRAVDFNRLLSIGDYFLSFRKYPIEQAKKVVQRSMRSHGANSGSARNSKRIDTDKSLEASEDIYEQLIEGTENLFDVQLWFLVRSNSEEELERETHYIVSAISQLDGKPLIETLATEKILQIYVPGNVNNFQRSVVCPTSYLACLLPFASEYIHQSGVSLSTRSFNEVLIDLFSPELMNFNALFTGTSGAGKTALAQKFIFEGLKKNISAVIIDQGYSFKRLTLYSGGNLFWEKINPMQFQDPVYLKEFILAAIPSNELKNKDKGRIYKLICAFLDTQSNKGFKSLIEFISTEIEEFDLYFAEYWQYISDECAEIKKITYVDLNKYPSIFKGSLIIYLMEFFSHIKGKKLLLIDEASNELKNNAEYVESKSRRIRKEDGSLVMISQGLNDFLSDEYSGIGRIIYNNSTHKFHFSEKSLPDDIIHSEDVEIIQKLKSVKGEYSECFYRNDTVRKVIRYYISPLELELFSTTKDHVEEIERFESKFEGYFNYETIMHKWIDFKYNHRGFDELT